MTAQQEQTLNDVLIEVHELVGLIKGTNGDGLQARFNKLETSFFNFLANRGVNCPMKPELDEIKKDIKIIKTDINELKGKPGVIARKAWKTVLKIVIGIVIGVAIAALVAILI